MNSRPSRQVGTLPQKRQEDGAIAKTRSPKVNRARELAIQLARTLEDKLAEDVLVLDMRKLMYLTDYFVMVTGRNVRHTQSLADEISRMLKAQGDRPLSVEGLPEGNWVLFDIGDVVVHIFDRATRQFYDLENLWADATRSRWRKPTTKSK